MLPTRMAIIKKKKIRSLVVQWLGHGAITALVPGFNPVWGTKISKAAWRSQNKNQKSHYYMKISFGVGLQQLITWF